MKDAISHLNSLCTLFKHLKICYHFSVTSQDFCENQIIKNKNALIHYNSACRSFTAVWNLSYICSKSLINSGFFMGCLHFHFFKSWYPVKPQCSNFHVVEFLKKFYWIQNRGSICLQHWICNSLAHIGIIEYIINYQTI